VEAAELPRVKRNGAQWDGPTAEGQCLCGDVRFQITLPARWAWHDHGLASQRAHGAAAATYVGAYKSRFRFTAGEALVTRYDDGGLARSFCSHCGSPLLYERPRAPEMVNIPRALFLTRTGREPRYHLNIDETPDWAYAGEPLKPLKGFPGVVWTGPRPRKRS
jgi:hypothetical protein